jgi:glycosyltransferase involved in cell wall biosynthesis
MISVVIPLYNKEKSIAKTLQSVLTQTYTDYEIIVVDDGSTDASVEVVQSVMKQTNKIQLLQKSNGGVSSARNYGIRNATSEYIAFLDGDDIWDKKYLEEQIRMIKEFPNAAMWSINYAETRDGQIVRRVATGLPEGYRGYVENYFHIKGRVSELFHSSSVVIRKEVFEIVGFFDERIKFAEDSDMWFRINAVYKTAFYDRYMVYYQLDAENRAMDRSRDLRYFLPYYVDKYKIPIFKQNRRFYRWVNRMCAVHIRRYYFSNNDTNRNDAKEAAAKLDYRIIPFKYRLFFKVPYSIASRFNKIDKWRRTEK